MSGVPNSYGSALDLARRFHELYERLAPEFGYETRQETRMFIPGSQNGQLMTAVCQRLIDEGCSGPNDAVTFDNPDGVNEAMAKAYSVIERSTATRSET